MKTQKLFFRKTIFILVNILLGFNAFFLLVLIGEILSGSISFGNSFYFEPIHFQIALLGGILQGSLKFFKYLNQSV